MAAKKPATATAEEPSSKEALDAYGGDPLNPNDAVLERIAAAINGEEDDMVTRWAAAFTEVCPEPAGQPKREFLAKLAEAVSSGEASEEIQAWASGENEPQPRSPYDLSHLGG